MGNANINYKGVSRDPFMVIILILVTCGLYGFYWIYVTTRDINNCLGEERIDPVLLLILSLLCGFVVIYWLYQIDKALIEIGQREHIPYNGNFVFWLVLCLVSVGYYVASFQTQEFMNKLWQKRA